MKVASCQGYSLQLTGTRGLVGEGGIEGVFEAFRGKDSGGYNQYHHSNGEDNTKDGSEIRWEGRLQFSYF